MRNSKSFQTLEVAICIKLYYITQSLFLLFCFTFAKEKFHYYAEVAMHCIRCTEVKGVMKNGYMTNRMFDKSMET